MFEIVFGASYILPLVMFIFWCIASVMATNLSYVKSNKHLLYRKNVLIGACLIALILGFLWYASILMMFLQNGWLFVEGTIKAIFPTSLIGNIAVIVYTLPRLKWRKESNDRIPDNQTLVNATNPFMVVPIYAAMVSTGIIVYLNIFSQPIQPSFFEIAGPSVCLILILIVPTFISIRKNKVALQGQLTFKSLGIRFLKFLKTMVVIGFIGILIIVVNVFIGISTTKLPESSDMMNHHLIDEGGGAPTMHSNNMAHGDHHQHHSKMVEVKDLTGDISAPADKNFVLVAEQKEISLQSGKKVKAWLYNGTIAPQLRVKEGEMIEIKLENKDIESGITIHWHGYNVPNAMDGVPGMTQDVVKPGESFTYKFHANQVGTYWFHSHQQASEQVKKGLFGSLIVETKGETEPVDEDITVINHRWETDLDKTMSFGLFDDSQLKQVQPGDKVRLRIINTDNLSRKYLLQGVDYKIFSIDGVPIMNPGQIFDKNAFKVAAGGRYDVIFTMPENPVQFKIGNFSDKHSPSIIFNENSNMEDVEFKEESDIFSPENYGDVLENNLTETKQFDREFKMIFSNEMGFYNGKPNFLWTINGEVFPHTPTFIVKEGEKIKTTFVNRSFTEHPMHLHGHHMTVLRKNGEKVKTPWITDTLNVRPGESYDVAFVADNPGMWMDHCHNLPHASVGMMLHLMYDQVTPSYEMGTRSGNLPD
ncbi:multicopper oxidase family protein [Bacillus sp. JJ1562]|uniref:multicopper oxidase family protein n=1 Tax=Bacillus sp. JJ1562 TaxID=3122960 RepID=UPI0030039ED6